MTWPIGNSMSQQLNKQAGILSMAKSIGSTAKSIGSTAKSIGGKAFKAGTKTLNTVGHAVDAHNTYTNVKKDATELKKPEVRPFQPKNWGASSQSYTKVSAEQEEQIPQMSPLDMVNFAKAVVPNYAKNTAKAAGGIGAAYMGHKLYNTGKELAKGSKDAIGKGFSHISIDDADKVLGARSASNSAFGLTAKNGLRIGKGAKALGAVAGLAGLAYGAKKGYTAYKQYKEQHNPQPPKYPAVSSPVQETGANPFSSENNQYARG